MRVAALEVVLILVLVEDGLRVTREHIVEEINVKS